MLNFIKNWLDNWSNRESLKTFGASRSPKWSNIRDDFIRKNPKCVACGSSKQLIVHHKKPFHLFPELELEKENLIVLCEGDVVNCHFLFGHCFNNWKCYNPNVEEDVKIIEKIRKCSKIGKTDL